MSLARQINDRPVRTALGRDGFARLVPVSRETLDRLEAYVGLLRSWNRRINLVGATTMGDPWRRHILDSAQLLPHLPAGARVLVDLGSGAGLPGAVLAAMGVPEVHLVESDQRKAAFLRELARIMDLPLAIHAERAERMRPVQADVVTARALAGLPDLLELVARFLRPGGRALLLKGRTADEELTLAAKHWTMKSRLLPSLADPGGRLLVLETLERVVRP
jgi:16S rRNA (guanine527-N7)-methyltransferase